MPRPASGRRSIAVALVVCLLAPVPVADAQATNQPPKSRLERLERWVDALERHQPGQSDAAVQSLDSWAATDLAELKITFYSLLQLMRDPSVRIFFLPGTGSRTPRQVLYSLGEIRQLLALAERLEPLGPNHVIKRGAMLHTDAAVGARADASGAPRRTELFVFQFSDGQELGQVDSIGHWDMARFLLDQVQRNKNDIRLDPGSDPWVRRWYAHAIAYTFWRMQFNVGIASRGVEIFRDDAELLFLAGVMHEALASTAVQEAFRNADYYLRNAVGLSTRRGELNAAEGLLRRATKSSPTFGEARLHLGHVLAEQEQHKNALAEFSQAMATMKNTDLLYFGHLFSGRSAAALGQAAAAREAFGQASRLRPNAQSPFLALSQLAYTRGDTGEAAAMLARVAELPALEGDDPWWLYNSSVGRFYEPLRRAMVDALREEMRK